MAFKYFYETEELSAIKDFKQIPFQQIDISTQMLTYSFGHDLTESERDWLFQELQTWLNNNN